MSSAQDAVDYSNQAQFRVVADTLCITKSLTLSTVADQQLYELPADVISLITVLDGPNGALPYISPGEALVLSTRSNVVDFQGPRFFTIGRLIGIYPVPTSVYSYTLWYSARPTPLTSATELEVVGDFERAVERLVQAMKLEDDGQPELAAEEKANYQLDLARLRREAALPGPAQARVIGFDQADRS
jgi:hypothetical protein